MNGLEFDPGFAPYIMAFQGTVEYLYTDINRFKNLSQKKIKFRQYYKKILEIFDNNLGFYIGCLMWASYIKTQPEQEILNNNAYGTSFEADRDTQEIDFMIRFAELFPRDMKYFLGQSFSFEPWIENLLKTYREFLVINDGFVNSKNNTDIKLPQNVNQENAESFKDKIDEVLKTGELLKLTEYKNILI